MVRVTRGSLASSLTVAGQFQPYQQVDLHAKVSGYIRWIKVDIGDRVRQGEVHAAAWRFPNYRISYRERRPRCGIRNLRLAAPKAKAQSAASTHSALRAAYTRLLEASEAAARPDRAAGA